MDGGSGSSRHIQDPEGLLRSALEKIVFFECRVSQLEAELTSALAAAERARSDGAQARRREVELEQALAAERGVRGGVERLAADADERVRLLETERERLLTGLVDRARIAGAPGVSGAPDGEDGQSDLAGFIAELRAEIESLRAFKASAIAAGFGAAAAGQAPRSPMAGERSARDLTELGGRFDAAGRVGVSAGDAARMKELLATRADRTLYERSMEDLEAPDAGRRLRAVHALAALGSRAAAPLLAAALGREPEAEVKAALLAALARLKEPFAADLAERELADRRPAVRVAALEALASAGDFRAAGRLAAALSDESALVRRRATLLLGFSSAEGTEDALAIALCDADGGVARAAAAALSGRPSARAQAALAKGLEHADASVRRAAATSLGRLSGETVDVDGPVSARRASGRRIAEKLAAMGADEIRAAVLRSTASARATVERIIATRTAASAMPSSAAETVARGAVHPEPFDSGAAERPLRSGQAKSKGPALSAARAAVAVLATPAPASAPPNDLEPRVVAEIRAALRGCTPDGLASALCAPPARVEAALAALAGRGAVELRGTRWFVT